MEDEIFMLGMSLHYGLITEEKYAESVRELLKPGPLLKEMMRNQQPSGVTRPQGDSHE